MIKMTKTDIRLLSLEDLQKVIKENGHKPFRAKQIYTWLWKHFADDFDIMSNIPIELREWLKEKYRMTVCETVNYAESDDKTFKMAFRMHDDFVVEGVIIPAQDRLTACISTQAGCPVKCTFCATGKMGFGRNLAFPEIYAQVIHLNQKAIENFGKQITNIVVMGMGEPLMNYDNVMQSLALINSEEGFNFSWQRITLSTIGLPAQIRKLADSSVRFRLAISLHATNDEQRQQIIPTSKEGDIQEIISALEYYYSISNQQVTFEYLLLKNFNDSRTDALKLAEICRKVPSKVNVIEYNTFEGAPYEGSDEVMVSNFCRILKEQGINCTLRQSKGGTISAACGQLSNKTVNKNN